MRSRLETNDSFFRILEKRIIYGFIIMSKQIIVIGAGIAGLTAAYTLQKHGFDVQVLEGAGRVGGRMTTDVTDGYIIDRGAQFLSTAYPILKSLIAELGLEAEFSATSPWAAIRRNGSIHKFRYDDLFSPVRSGLLTWREWFKLGFASARWARHLFKLSVSRYADWAGFDRVSATDWYNAHYGEWMTEYLIEPMLEGFYFQSPEETSCALPIAVSAFLARGAKTMTLRRGIGSLPEALASKLNVALNEPVERISIEGDSVRVLTNQRELRADKVIVAVPAHVAKRLCADSGKVAAELLNTPYASTVNLALGTRPDWRIPEALDGVYGLLIPRRERQHIAAIAIETAKHRERAQSGYLLNVMVDGKSGAAMLAWDEAKILDTLCAELDGYLPGFAGQVVFSQLYRWKYAEPKSPLGRAIHIREYREQVTPESRLLLAGDYMGMPFTEGAAETGLWAAHAVLSTSKKEVQGVE